ncbi:(2Fe-2S)-binding protein [Paraburkholderia unamae]|uniref:Xanthine dehydrogenase YagT iron-sulfur-binding subunit n=1 Tax=Paraburkholderia unamae TaxID=219649 RepID=A0ABX5K7F9_9BURK|nr:(2Fe-2S)-binding protein [Paraburkholderia unamae]PVX61379.1 xanthine dehydrogenase YagT iron-sulfur-binding subunit [Paraburkholderia unamae]RAR49307.1 xanthine dehydrogenase YagT iron-sulfur-binding subunit [Paraburkholderia unamae]
MHTAPSTRAPRPHSTARKHADTEPRSDTESLPDAVPVELTVNGTHHALRVEPWTSLLDLLREQLQLTGTKKGCDHGQCGACTVLVNGTRINACLALAVSHDGADVTTVEGLAQDGALHPVQQAFIEHDAFQCGYCTPGQVCSAVGLLAEGHAQCRDDVREQMSGNLCRCGAYVNIANAVEAVRRVECLRNREGDDV